MSRAGVVIWLTGRPAAGKSSLAAALRGSLIDHGRATCVLDSDEVRGALVPPPGYGAADRDRFYETLARLAALLAGQELVVLVPATAHRRAHRDAARALAPRFIELYVNTATEECARRDPKGLYAAAAAGRLRDLPGVDVDYEEPLAPDIIATGGRDDAAVAAILDMLRQ